ncbi:unnamed protein product [Closterium sp. NIES-54]
MRTLAVLRRPRCPRARLRRRSGGGGSGGGSGGGGGSSGGGRVGAVLRGGSGGGQRRQQQRRSETPSPQQLREWFSQRGASGGSGSCPYIIRTGDRAGQACRGPHTQYCCFFRLDDASRAEFGEDAERPCWAELLRSRVAIFDIDYDAILAAIYALSVSAEDVCYLCVPPDLGIEAVALGSSESALPSTTPAEALHTFTLDSHASRCFFRYSTTLTPLSAPVPVRLANPSGAPFLPVPPLFSRQVAPPCSCCLLSHQTLLWHYRLGHPSLPRLRGMHSRLLVSGLPRSLPALPPSPGPPCLPCVKGRQRAAPHSSSFPPRTAPLHPLHMDVWGPTRVSRQGCECYFLHVVDDYTRNTTVFPLCSKGEVPDVLIPWIRAVRLQLRERFRQDLPVLRLHSDRGGEFSSDLLRDFCRGEGILQSFTLPASPQQNGIAVRRIGLVMEVARTSMIHAACPHFLWPFAVRYAAHQLNLWLHDYLSETSPMLCWTGKVGDATVFRVWGSRAFVRNTSADKLSARAIPFVFLGFPPNAPGWQFYHPTSRRVIPSQDAMFDESVPFYHLFPYRSAPFPPPPLFLAPSPPPVDPLPPQGAASGGAASRGAEPRGAEPGGGESEGVGSGGAEPPGVEAGGAEPEGAESEGAESGGAEPGCAKPTGVEPVGDEPEGAESEGAESGSAEPLGTTSFGGAAGALPRLSPWPKPLCSQQLREWFAQCTRLGAGAGGAGVGGTGVGGEGAGGAGAVDPRAGGAGAGGAVSGGTRAGGTVRPRPYFVPLLHQVLSLPSSTGFPPSLLSPPPLQWQPQLQLGSPVPSPSHYTEQTGGLTERCEPRPFVSRLLTTVVTDPSFESTAASALVAELVEFAVVCRLDYATALVAESEQEDFECLTAAIPHFASMHLASEGDPDSPDIPTLRSYVEAITGTYVDAVPPSGANIVVGIWIFRVKRPSGSPPAFKARYVARGFSQR